jgi:superfamily II DNA or RNA helicase
MQDNQPSQSSERLRDIEYSLLYETATTDLIDDFYTPSLEAASEYKRAVGYFTSSWFEEAAAGIAAFANNGGTARWIISPKLTEEDWTAIEQGDAAKRDPSLYEQMETLVEELESDLQQDTQNTIAWLIADGLLRVRIAVTDEELGGDFHDKWGIFIDGEDKVAFHGSQNDSRKSLSNYEANSVFTSWGAHTDQQRVAQHEDRFDSIWANTKPGVHSFSLPDSISLGIAELRSSDRPYHDPGEETKLTSAYRWRHQEEAVEAFLKAKTGLLDMATGTGKTRTSLKIIDQLLRDDIIETLVIATRGNDLLNQWNETVLEHFSAEEMFLYRQYSSHKDLASYLMNDSERLDILLTSYANLEDAIDGDMDEKLANGLLICDEVHNIGAQGKQEALGGRLSVFPYRLGLSATPFDPYDPDRNEFIRNEIGPVVYEFGLEPAIKRGILTEFDYTPITYELSEEDKARQKKQFKKFAGLKRQNPSVPQSQLYIMLSRVRKESEEKLPKFRRHLERNPDVLEDTIIFVASKDYGTKVQQIIYDYVDNFHTYYGEDDESKLDEFSTGKLSTLVTSKAISEGIDIQSVKNIILFSAPRSKGTTTQRIGRALRKDPSNPDKRANVIDFVVKSDIEQKTVDNDDGADEVDEDTKPPDRERYEWLNRLSKITQQE